MNFQDIKNKKIFRLILITAVLIAVVLVVYNVSGLSRITTDDAYVEGRVHSISSKINGTVKAVAVEDNQTVKKGDILVEVDPEDYVLKVKEAQASFDISNVSFEQASRDKERAEALYKEEVFAKERYENTMTEYNLAKAKKEAAQVQLNIAQRNLEYTKIFSPSAGNVTKRSVEAGNQIQAGQPLMAIVALDDIWVLANYKETQLKKVKPGQQVLIKVDTYPGKIFKGRVESIMSGTGSAFSLFPPENALGSYVKVVQRIPVKIVFDKVSDDKQVLRIGMSCVTTILTKNE